MKTQYFESQKSKLQLEAILKSALLGLAVGCGVSFITGLVFWLTGVEIIWILPVAMLVATLIAAPIFYFTIFSPSDVANARRLDRLGLEERMITMVELEKDESCIARLQREDAQRALSTLSPDQLKIKIAKSILIPLIVCFVLATAMTTVNILTKYGLILGGDEIIDSITAQLEEQVTVTYEIEEGGVIEGDEEQIIVLGTDCTPVTAVADEGYMFKAWSDGLTTPTRQDFGVTESVTYTAIFTPMNGEEGEEGTDGAPGDQPGDQPGQNDKEGDEDAPGGDGEFNPEADAAGGSKKQNNQVINGQTYYREVLEYYQDLAEQQMNGEGSELTDAEIDLIKQYLGIV